jgi:hypothetical protein
VGRGERASLETPIFGLQGVGALEEFDLAIDSILEDTRPTRGAWVKVLEVEARANMLYAGVYSCVESE